MKRLVPLLLVAAPLHAQSLLAPPHPLFGETGHVQMNGNTGELTIQYPFELPPARGKYAAALSLMYSSGNGSTGLAGLGWGVTFNYIQKTLRAPPLGVDASGNTVERDQYWLILGGDRKLLVATAPNTFKPDVSHAYLSATLNAGQPPVWTLVDGFGTTFTFVQVGTDGSRWYLKTAVDLDGNTTSFDYVADDDLYPGHYLLSAIHYNNVGSWFGHHVVLAYGCPDSTNGDCGSPAKTVVVEGGEGILAFQRKKLSTVIVQRQASSGATPVTLYSYQLSYRQSSETRRWLLTGIAQRGRDGTPLGVDGSSNPFGVQFGYTPFTAAFSLSSYAELSHPQDTPTTATCGFADLGGTCADGAQGMNGSCQAQDVAAWMDLDGDGLPDMVWGETMDAFSSGGGLRWARNRSTPGAPGFGPVVKLAGSDQWNGGGASGGAVTFNSAGAGREPDLLRGPRWFSYQTGSGMTMLMVDFDGDGRPDLLSVQARECTQDQVAIWFNRPDPSGAPSFTTPAKCATLPAGLIDDMRLMAYDGARMLEWSTTIANANASAQYLGLYDMNGDGVLDFVASAGDSLHVYRGFRTMDGNFGFAAMKSWTFPGATDPNAPRWSLRSTSNFSDCGPTHPRVVTTALMDVNGDGLPDYVVTPRVGPLVDPSCYGSVAGWVVYYNTGAGFATRSDGFAWAGNTNDPLVTFDKITDRNNTYQQVALSQDLTRDGTPDRLTNGNSPACKFRIRANYGWGFADDTNAKCIDAPSDLSSSPSSAFNRQGAPDWMFDQPGQYCGNPTGATSCTSTPKLCGCSSDALIGYCAPAGKNALFLDLDGDGVPDYVAADPYTHSLGWYRGTPALANPPPDDPRWVRGELVSSVLQLGGARTDVTYASSNTFGQAPDGGSVRYVVSRTVLSGPGLQGLATDYQYRTPRTTAALDDPTRREALGFADSWSRDSTTGLVQHTSWGGSCATNGLPVVTETRSAVAAGQPLSSSAAAIRATSHTYGAQWATRTGRCPGDAGSLTGSDLPVVLYEGSSADTIIDLPTGLTLSATKSVACGDVDIAGHVLRASITPDTSDITWNGRPGVRVENSKYPTPGNTSCTDCVLEAWATDPSAYEVYHRWYVYDTKGHLDHLEELAGGVHEISEYNSYNPDGTLATVRKDYAAGPYTGGGFSVVKTLTYDPLGLAIAHEQNSDGQTTLTTDTTIDATTGLPAFTSGPNVQGSGAAAAKKYFTYDAFYRLVALSRGPTSGSTISQAITAMEYVPASSTSTGAVRAYSFATPLSFALGQVPTTDDVVLAIGYFDASGRSVQTRKRLGASTPGDASANIELHLSSGRYVVDSTIYDGAGRELHHLDPYYSASAAFFDFWAPGAGVESTADAAVPHATSKGYDGLGRLVCTIYWPLGATLPIAPSDASTCVSSFAENGGYRRATSARYGADNSLWRTLFTQDTVADWINTPSRPVGDLINRTAGTPATRKYLDAAGRVIYERDAYGNFTETKRDVVGRTTAAIRRAGLPGSGNVKVSFITTYDQRGRVVQEDDDSSGTKVYTYLPTGERVLSKHLPLRADASSSVATFEVRASRLRSPRICLHRPRMYWAA
jgi:Salmonella virulence plasmid 65kDa B protein